MPSYSFCCLTCGEEQDVFLRVSERESGAPVCCGVKMARVYRAAQVVKDFYVVDREVPCLNSLDDDVMKDPPLFGTRTEEKAYRRKHQEIFGWGLE